MHRTQSSTPLDKVAVEIDPSGMLSHVWLRANIEEKIVTENDVSYTMYEADEVYITIPGVCAVESVESMFETLWAQAENSNASLNDRISVLEAKIDDAMQSIAMNTLEIATK